MWQFHLRELCPKKVNACKRCSDPDADTKAMADAAVEAMADAKAIAGADDAKAMAEVDVKAEADAEAMEDADAKAMADAPVEATADADADAKDIAGVDDAKAMADADVKAEADAESMEDVEAKADEDAKAMADAAAEPMANAAARAEADVEPMADAAQAKLEVDAAAAAVNTSAITAVVANTDAAVTIAHDPQEESDDYRKLLYLSSPLNSAPYNGYNSIFTRRGPQVQMLPPREWSTKDRTHLDISCVVLHGRIYRDGTAQGCKKILLTFCLVQGGDFMGIQMTEDDYDTLVKYKCVWNLGQLTFTEQPKASPQPDASTKPQLEEQTNPVVDLTYDVGDVFTIITPSF